jgi:uncharacterized protein (TIGR03067 family)
MSPAFGDDRPDSEMILGHWEVVASTYPGKPFKKKIGSVYTFKSDRTLEVSDVEYDARMEYRLDAQATPPTLILFFSNPRFAGTGIYRIEGDQLTWRESADEQSLTFATPPKGK